MVLWLARRYSGLGLRELGKRVGGLDYTSVSLAVKRLGQRAARDKTLRRVLEKCEKELGVREAKMSNVEI